MQRHVVSSVENSTGCYFNERPVLMPPSRLLGRRRVRAHRGSQAYSTLEKACGGWATFHRGPGQDQSAVVSGRGFKATGSQRYWPCTSDHSDESDPYRKDPQRLTQRSGT